MGRKSCCRGGMPRPGLAEDQLGEAIKERCKTDLARFKRPKEIIFVKQEEMPRTPTGKILHRKLREMCGGGKLPRGAVNSER